MKVSDSFVDVLKNMNHLEEYGEWEYTGGFLVVKVYDIFILFETEEGCEPRFAGTFRHFQTHAIFEEIERWT